MFTTDLVLACCIGLLAMCAIYIGLRRAFGGGDSAIQRAMAVFSAVSGITVAWFLWKNPDLLHQQATRIVLALIAVVLAVTAVAKRNVS